MLAFTQTFEHSPGAFAKDFATGQAGIALTLVTMDFDVTLLYLTSFGTMLVSSELLSSVHRLWFFIFYNQILPDERFLFNFL